MNTLTIITVDWFGYEILIPIVEDVSQDLVYTNSIYKALQSDSQFEILRNPSWNYTDSVANFNNIFYYENENRKVQYLEIYEKDFSNFPSITTPFGQINLPTEKSYAIRVIVKGKAGTLKLVNETNLPVLRVTKGENNE